MSNIFTERLWRTVKYEHVYLQDAGTPRAVRTGLHDYFAFYNYRRPHQALAYQTPAAVYARKEACTSQRAGIPSPPVAVAGAALR